MDTEEKIDPKKKFNAITQKYNRHIIAVIVVMCTLIAGFVLFGVQGIDALMIYQIDVWNRPPKIALKVIAISWLASLIVIPMILPFHAYIKPNGKGALGLRSKKTTEDGITKLEIVRGDPQRGIKKRYVQVGVNWSYWNAEKSQLKKGWLHFQGREVELDMIEDVLYKARKWEARTREIQQERRQDRRERQSDIDQYRRGYSVGLPPKRSGTMYPPTEVLGDAGSVE